LRLKKKQPSIKKLILLDIATENNHIETADLLRKHGGKTGKELKAEGK